MNYRINCTDVYNIGLIGSVDISYPCLTPKQMSISKLHGKDPGTIDHVPNLLPSVSSSIYP